MYWLECYYYGDNMGWGQIIDGYMGKWEFDGDHWWTSWKYGNRQ
jgi:hypothetical protein